MWPGGGVGGPAGKICLKKKIMAIQPTPPNVPPPRNKGLIRPYQGKPTVNKPLIRPYFWGGMLGGGWLTSHKKKNIPGFHTLQIQSWHTFHDPDVQKVTWRHFFDWQFGEGGRGHSGFI